jgi:putative nucleotidyltransferase with HDIG domain
MVAMLLRLVNSAFYGLRSRVGTIVEATVILGFNTIQNAILSMSVCLMFSGRRANGGCDTQGIWRHSLAVAVTARHLALRTRRVAPENAFVGGLLHDIGKTVLCQYFDELFRQVRTVMIAEGLDFHKAEKRALALQHPYIGSYLAEKWRLPPALVEAIRQHHRSPTSNGASPLVLLTWVANAIVNNRLTSESNGGPLPLPEIPESSAWLAPHLSATDEWFPKLAEEIEAACAFFLQPR